MKRSLLVLFMVGLFSASSLHGQAAIHFDKAKPRTLKGTVAGIALMRDRSYIVLNVKDEATNTMQQWAIEGNDRDVLIDAGWELIASPGQLGQQGDGINVRKAPYRGDTVEVIVYPPLETAKFEDIIGGSPATIGGVPEGLSPDSPFARLASGPLKVDLLALFKLGRFVHGTEATFANGKKLTFGAKP